MRDELPVRIGPAKVPAGKGVRVGPPLATVTRIGVLVYVPLNF